jgi:hypothetical protein
MSDLRSMCVASSHACVNARQECTCSKHVQCRRSHGSSCLNHVSYRIAHVSNTCIPRSCTDVTLRRPSTGHHPHESKVVVFIECFNTAARASSSWKDIERLIVLAGEFEHYEYIAGRCIDAGKERLACVVVSSDPLNGSAGSPDVFNPCVRNNGCVRAGWLAGRILTYVCASTVLAPNISCGSWWWGVPWHEAVLVMRNNMQQSRVEWCGKGA